MLTLSPIGGLSTSFQSLKANILFSIAVALTGIGAPIGLSFTLGGITNATSLQSFTAGAALCSTSLGTTFTILRTTGLLKTRLGVVLTSAAMLDDVVGLVMVRVISNLGGSASDFSAITVIRPVFVSVAFAVMCPLLCWFVLKPMTLKLNELREKKRDGLLHRIMCREEVAFSLHTVLFIGMVTGSTYAGTSNLFAAYLAGAIISWWDTEIPHCPPTTQRSSQEQEKSSPVPSNEGSASVANKLENSRSGTAIYEKYYLPANERILKPFFFVSSPYFISCDVLTPLTTSIGFSIPITRMFNGSIVWRGVIYSILMLIAKLLCGAWLIRFSMSLPYPTMLQKVIKAIKYPHIPHLWGKDMSQTTAEPPDNEQRNRQHILVVHSTEHNAESSHSTTPAEGDTITLTHVQASPQPEYHGDTVGTASLNTVPASKPFSLYPGAILGLAMVARGEIGFLISSLAESNGIFSTDGNDQVFLIVTWAIALCTIVGPVGVGLLVRRVKRLEKAKEEQTSGRDVLGVWGVS
jgi:Kef-type K+ transport system membrane component KefB